ncbi:acyl transferase/acyl hydrolase/lysophospholipase [Aspergillus californicus]
MASSDESFLDCPLPGIKIHNNIQRTRSAASIGLRVDNVSERTREPHFFVDVGVGRSTSSSVQTQAILGSVVHEHPITWKTASTEAAVHVILARLVFLFADVICIFVGDFPTVQSAAHFLVACVVVGSASSLPLAVRPRVVVVLDGGPDRAIWQAEEDFDRTLEGAGCESLTRSFSGVKLVSIDRSSDVSIRHHLRATIKGQLEDVRRARRDHGALFSALQIEGLFDLATTRLALDKNASFNFIKATRQGNPVSKGLGDHVSHYLDIGKRAGCTLDTLVSSIASALLMDHYLPGAILLEPRAVFRTLYLSPLIRGIRDYDDQQKSGTEVGDLTGQVELDAQHAQACHHALCDICAQLFGRPAADAEYQFTVSNCLICLSGGTLVIDVLPPTMNPTILAIDGGGVRGGIPLEYLLLIQEQLGPQCSMRDLVDLSVGSSSGGLIVLGLAGMGWDVSACSEVFDRLARRIFRERRRGTLSKMFRLILGRDSLLGGIFQWVSWLLHDSCYDPRVFDASLREAFGEARRIFDVVGTGSELHSRSKFGVIATSIAKETRSFVFGNFNAADWSTGEHEHELFRAENIQGEPLICDVGRATAAAPFYFSPAHTRVGSFQDGGLKDNFAAGIARRVSRRIWPSRAGVGKLISLGTGKTESPGLRSPHFRHVFRDGFLRRGFDALMSNLDTKPKWLELQSELEDGTKDDYLWLNVELHDIPCTIDDISVMDSYRNLVTSQVGAVRQAKEAAIALLVARFYFELDNPPTQPRRSSQGWYRGTIRCKGPARHILDALHRLYPSDVDFVTDTGFLGQFGGLAGICFQCGHYVQSVSVFAHHPKEPLNIYIRTGRQKRWKISGFPASLWSFTEAKNLYVSLGRPSHDRPTAAPCAACDSWEGRLRNEARKSPSVSSPAELGTKRLCVVGEIRDH